MARSTEVNARQSTAISRPPGTAGITRTPTAGLAAAGLIGGFAVATASGSRPLGGAVMAAFGLPCIAIWLRRHSRRTAAGLAAAGLLAFAVSHALGLVIGPWPAVLVVAAATAALYWVRSDSPQRVS